MASDQKKRRVRIVDVGDYWPSTGEEDGLLAASHADERAPGARGGAFFTAEDLAWLDFEECFFRSRRSF